MPKIIFIGADGATREVTASADQSVMEVALGAGVPGIVAECNGAAACATCHCYFDPA
jgi:2Fe-2S ferredoxin